MDFPFGATLTVRHIVETTDELGDTTYSTTTTSWGPCAVAPRYADESLDPSRPPVVVGKTIYGPPITLAAADEVDINGEVWQVDGLASEFFGAGANPFTGWEPGIAVPVKRVTARSAIAEES